MLRRCLLPCHCWHKIDEGHNDGGVFVVLYFSSAQQAAHRPLTLLFFYFHIIYISHIFKIYLNFEAHFVDFCVDRRYRTVLAAVVLPKGPNLLVYRERQAAGGTHIRTRFAGSYILEKRHIYQAKRGYTQRRMMLVKSMKL